MITDTTFEATSLRSYADKTDGAAEACKAVDPSMGTTVTIIAAVYYAVAGMADAIAEDLERLAEARR